MKIARRMSRLGTETAFDVLAEVNRLKAQGKHIISFSIGEPDFDQHQGGG
jgi:aspartate/methionine/tyrosine aminotransferase